MGNLASILVGTALAGIVIAGASNVFVFGEKQFGFRKMEERLLELKGKIITQVNCEQTIKRDTCQAAGQLVALRDRNGTILFQASGPGTRIAEFTVRGECNSTLDGLILRAARLKPQGTLTSTQLNDFEKDAVTQVAYTWSAPQTLLIGQGITYCPINDKISSISSASFKVSSFYPSPYPVTYTHNLGTDQYVTNIQTLNNGTIGTWLGFSRVRYDSKSQIGYGISHYYTDTHLPNSVNLNVRFYTSGNVTSITDIVNGTSIRSVVVPYAY